MELRGSDPFTWRRIVRRARLGSTVKLVACVLADYANPDGTNARPGNLRLKLTTELSDKSVRRALEVLRELGLIERVFAGSKMGRRGLADEYRLTIPVDLMERVAMLDPDELTVAPVTGTGVHPVDEAVDNTRSPVTGTSVDAPPESGTPVTGSRTPVTGSRNTGTCDRPPNQAPTSTTPTNKNDGLSDHGAELEDAGPILVAADEKNDLDAEDEAARYAAARRILSRLPDLGAHYQELAQAEIPDAGMKELVVRAAQIAAKGIPA